MPTTPDLALPYPAPGESPAGHSQIQTLATAAEARLKSALLLPRMIENVQGVYGDTHPADTYGFVPSGALKILTTADGTAGAKAFHWVGADFPAISGLDPKWRLRAFATSNNFNPNSEFVFKVYQIADAFGPADNTGFILGAQVAGLTGSIISSAEMSELVSSAHVAAPVTGLYVVAVTIIGTPSADSRGLLGCRLEVIYE